MNMKKNFFNFPMGKTKLIGLLTILLIGVLAVCGVANATITIDKVKVDGDELGGGINTLGVERGDEIQIKVWITSDQDVDDVQVETYLRGYDHDDRAEDITDSFDMNADSSLFSRNSANAPMLKRPVHNHASNICGQAASLSATLVSSLGWA